MASETGPIVRSKSIKMTELNEENNFEMCRVCRMESTSEKPLFYPCLCTGSIKFIHQECLTEWLKYSKKDVCELCNHQYKFTPGRINRSLFKGPSYWIWDFTADLFKAQDVYADCIQGLTAIMLALCVFISLIWLREQILIGGFQMPVEIHPEEAAENMRANQPFAGEIAGDAAGQGAEEEAGVENENNWQLFEWERAGEELTWDRLFGFDGSLVFLEHVFWVISLNTLFVLLFVMWPFYVGYFFSSAFNITEYMKAAYFDGFITTVLGYFILGFLLFLCHALCGALRLVRFHRTLGMCYLMLKVVLIVLIEVGVFPLFCGWWLDMCSLPLFAETPESRLKWFYDAPELSLFVHWLVGMVYVFYFASFILILREVMRPGVLWFLRNVNDPDFNPIQEMVQYPVIRHVRRFLASVLVFALTILICVYCPFRIILRFMPSTLPYRGSNRSDLPFLSLFFELLLLQVILPTLLEQSHTRQILKVLIFRWCKVVGKLLGLTDYLLSRENNGAVPREQQNDRGRHLLAAEFGVLEEDLDRNLGAAHHMLLIGGRSSTQHQPYVKPPYFLIRIIALLLVICVSSITFSLIALTVPVTIGRKLMHCITGTDSHYELYTLSCGLYICCMLIRLFTVSFSYIPRDFNMLADDAKAWLSTVLINWLRFVVAVISYFGLVAFMFGFLVELMIVAPLRVPRFGTALPCLFMIWLLGAFYCKIFCVCMVTIGPNWRMRHAFETLYRDGPRNMNLQAFMTNAVLPLFLLFGNLLAVPYTIVYAIFPILGCDAEDQLQYGKRIYPGMLSFFLLFVFLAWQFKKVKAMMGKIRNERYLLGQRLVNFDSKRDERALSSLVV
ncbi:E3 ubiquitin-protein ligase MARCH6 [Trichinella britovi]|uniref:RING-type E3 ubiquitin transferase n=1 Tax=Trichinella britovi TaxID=45882 RepID=A0A0V1D572_TRIBR|nr:E3 ubiquitin-protein ligase MARCH6 [Trichinella britovi]